ncbi:hypothetical protein JOC94_000826 [Bacillus thermophilus]|uniref:Uncharacterized protein n=1 Tax=Siminovitchia thermophila TaxID=1245522 RepID=A0ABS2R2I4_9BACI|nr:hypothetical protein [Siminovitchia thermophila]
MLFPQPVKVRYVRGSFVYFPLYMVSRDKITLKGTGLMVQSSK